VLARYAVVPSSSQMSSTAFFGVRRAFYILKRMEFDGS
jgi:hypothetical protein